MFLTSSTDPQGVPTRTEVLRFIAVIRESNPNAVALYTQGQCYGFAKILRERWPAAVFWYDPEPGHVYTKIGAWWYDVEGVYRRLGPRADVLCHRTGHKPHRWGRGDKRDLLSRSE